MNVIKLILGGVVAVLSALGMTLAVLMASAVLATRDQKATGLGAVAGGFTAILHTVWFWLAVFVIFSVGLFLAYRKLYF